MGDDISIREDGELYNADEDEILVLLEALGFEMGEFA